MNTNEKRKGAFFMENTDTVKLLRECDAGSKMAVSSIDDVLEMVKDSKLLSLLKESKAHHEELGNEIHRTLNRFQVEEKDPSPMAKGMSWMKTNVKISMDHSDATVADLLTDGCHMGIKSLHRYMNQYKNADHVAKELCGRLIAIEEELCKELRKYL